MKEHEVEKEKEAYVEGDQKETQEEVEDEADGGEMMVLRRVLSVQKGANDEQKKNIFHSQCMVQGKVCSMIINGGSYATLSMIKKLGL